MERSKSGECAVSSHFILKCGVGLITSKRFKVNSIPVICSIFDTHKPQYDAVCGFEHRLKTAFVLYLFFICSLFWFFCFSLSCQTAYAVCIFLPEKSSAAATASATLAW